MIFAMAFTMISGLEQVKVFGATYNLSNPRVTSEKSTWDCIYFGEYPQTEIVAERSQCGTYGRDWEESNDCIIDANLYNQLNNSNWSNDGTCKIGNSMFKRIKKSDASFTNNSGGYYKWSDSSTYHYFIYEPIKWRVLNVNENNAFLLSNIGLDNQQYNHTLEYSTWENSTLRGWLNGTFFNSF